MKFTTKVFVTVLTLPITAVIAGEITSVFKIMNDKKVLEISTAAFFITPIVGVLIAAFMPSYTAQAHYVETDLNHAHICTMSTALNIRQEPNIKSKKLGELTQGKVIHIKAMYSDWDTNETWYKIKPETSTKNISGWVSSQYVCF